MKSNNLNSMLYINFLEIGAHPLLNHNRKEINRLIHSPDAQIYFYLINSQIASYLVGEIMKLNDGRMIFYITYLYTSKKFRKHGLATKLMQFAEKIALEKNLDGMMLTCDTENSYVYNYYLLKGFMPDIQLRTYNKYDVLYKIL
jgi:GNAT superfamily N-acetyltransferase